MSPANLSAAFSYMRSRYPQAAGGMTAQLFTQQPPGKSSGTVSGSGYTRGGSQSPAHFRSALMNQSPPPGTGHCTCPSCQSFRRQHGLPSSPYAPGGIISSPPAVPASPPPSFTPSPRPKPRTWGARGMDGFDGAPLVAGTALGYRWWTMRAPQLHKSPSGADQDWEPGLLRGVKGFWQPGVNQAKCMAPARHDFSEIPHSNCACGYWAYWEIQQHDMGANGSLPVFGVVRASGQVIMGPRGFRAQKAEIVALHLPFRIEPDLPADDPLPLRLGRRPSARFTGRVINFPGAPPVPYSLGGQPPPLPDLSTPAAPEPPSDEEIQAAKDKAEAWMAVIEHRLETAYPGAEVCATLDLMKAKYPVVSEYEPPEPQVSYVPCSHCGVPCDPRDLHMHIVSNHYF